MQPQQSIEVAVVMERTAAPNAWEAWAFRVAEVVPDEGAFGREPRRLRDDGKTSTWLYPGFTIGLYPDECKGYFLNLTSGRPAWFVSWVPDDADPSIAHVTGVSVSYIEADRRMTAEEHVETIPLEPELCEWLRLFTNEHFRPETKRKVRAMSFLRPEERERQMAIASAAAVAEAAAPAVSPEPTVEPDQASQQRERNAALRAMFHSDPHFRQSDGLDVSVAEVHEIEGSPRGRQRKIQLARELGLLDDELRDQEPPPAETPPGGADSEPRGG